MHTDIYSLGVILYELLAGKLPVAAEHPAKPTGDADLDLLCLTAMHPDPQRRYRSAQALIHDIDRYLNHQALEARPDSLSYAVAGFTRRNWKKASMAAAMLALVAGAVGVTRALSRQTEIAPHRARTVAVLPLRNAGKEPDVDFLRLAIANEISETLGYARSLSLRPAAATGKYTAPDLDLQKAGHELRVESVITGRFLKAGEQSHRCGKRPSRVA